MSTAVCHVGGQIHILTRVLKQGLSALSFANWGPAAKTGRSGSSNMFRLQTLKHFPLLLPQGGDGGGDDGGNDVSRRSEGKEG
jgi:hypothetical protein